MFDKLAKLFAGEAPTVSTTDELQLAVVALLVEAARADEDFSAEERSAIERMIVARFGLSAEEARALFATAENTATSSTQVYRFTRPLLKRFDAEERIKLIEMLWEVAYADGRLDAHEDAVLRHVAGLIHVPDRDRMLARQRVLQRKGIAS